MKIDHPAWHMSESRCLYCEQGELVFSKCPQCGVVVLICAECGTVYGIDGKHVGKEIGDTSGSTRCFSCGEPLHEDFPLATTVEIQAIGFQKEEYR